VARRKLPPALQANADKLARGEPLWKKPLTAAAILKAMAEDGQLAEDVLTYLAAGVWDEWDCALVDAAELGFGPDEWAIAARTGAVMAEYQQKGRKA
jgi:hypothetical protein